MCEGGGLKNLNLKFSTFSATGDIFKILSALVSLKVAAHR